MLPPSTIQLRHADRRGSTTAIIAGLMVAVVAIAGAIWWFFLQGTETDSEAPIVETVQRGVFESRVLDQGEVESSENVIFKSEVEGTTSIITIVPEGTMVSAGDVLVELDRSELDAKLETQQITVNTSESLVIQAEAALEAANVAKEEYVLGTFQQEEQTIQNEIFEAEENLRKSEQYLAFSEKLAARQFVTQLQLEADRFAVKKAENALALAKKKLEVLRNQTKRKMLIQLDSDIRSAKVRAENEKESHQVELGKLEDIRDQITKCTITVPEDVSGQVVHANRYSRRGGAEWVAEEGAMVREQQDIIKLPNPEKMQVKAKVNESRVTKVKPDMDVSIRLDALGKDESLSGTVIKVNQYAEPDSWGSGGVKEYGVIIRINDPPPNIRPGMNASVNILILQHDLALQIPLQSIYDYRGHTFCLVQDGDKYRTEEFKVLATNDTHAMIEPLKKLTEGDSVVVNPRRHESLLELPDLPEVVVKKSKKAKDGGGGKKGSKNKGSGGGPGDLSPSAMVKRTLEEHDKDSDGKLSSAEIANVDDRLRSRLSDADTNKDGFVDRAELTKAMTKLVQMIKQRMQQGGGGPPGAGR